MKNNRYTMLQNDTMWLNKSWDYSIINIGGDNIGKN